MITSIEIRNQGFSKALRGYNEEEVKKFLNNIAYDYELLYSENAQLKENIQKLEYDLNRYHRIEETMNNSLILAQQTAEQYKKNAQKEAELMLEEARKKVTEILSVYQDVIKRLSLFNAELKAHVGGQMEMIDKYQGKIEEISSFLYGKDLKFLVEKLEKIKMED